MNQKVEPSDLRDKKICLLARRQGQHVPKAPVWRQSWYIRCSTLGS